METNTKEKLWTKNFVVISGAGFLMATIFNLLMVTMAPYTMETYDASTAEAGLVSGLFIIGVLFGRLYIGRKLIDLETKRLLILGLCLFVGSLLLYFIQLGIAFLLFTRFLHGLSYGIVTTTNSTIIAVNLPKSRKGEGIGYYTMCVTLSTAIGPLLGVMMSKYSSYSATFWLCFILGLLTVLLVLISPIPSLKKDHSQEKKKLSLDQLFEPKVFKIVVIVVGTASCYASILTFINLYAAEINLVEAAGGWFLVYAISILISRPITGKMADKKGENYVMYPCIVILALGMTFLSFAHSSMTLLLSAVFVGVGFGNIQSTAQTVAIKMTTPERMGLAVSTYYIAMDIALGLSPTLLGMILPWLGYRHMYTALACLSMIMLVVYHFVYGKNKKNRETVLPFS